MLPQATKPTTRARVDRPTKLTPEVHRKIIEILRLGYSLETAAEYTGIAHTTIYQWLCRGKQETAGPFKALSDEVRSTTLGGWEPPSSVSTKICASCLQAVVSALSGRAPARDVLFSPGQKVRICSDCLEAVVGALSI